MPGGPMSDCAVTGGASTSLGPVNTWTSRVAYLEWVDGDGEMPRVCKQSLMIVKSTVWSMR
jgi:hypothetical protein